MKKRELLSFSRIGDGFQTEIINLSSENRRLRSALKDAGEKISVARTDAFREAIERWNKPPNYDGTFYEWLEAKAKGS